MFNWSGVKINPLHSVRMGPCMLICADTLELLPDLIKGGHRAALIVTDAPYLLTTGGKTEGGLHERFGAAPGIEYENDGNLFEGECPDWLDFMPMLHNLLRDPGHCYSMADGKNQFPMQKAAEVAGFRFHQLLTWDKKAATPNRQYMKNVEFTGLFYKGHAFTINEPESFAGVAMKRGKETGHPTEKPVELMRYYIRNSSQPGEEVWDPFMGTGTTAIAAMREGRGFVGIERDPRWFKIAVDRITKEMQSPQGSFLGC